MAKIAYILLCHKDPQAIIAQANRLTAVGDYISIHFDGRSKDADFKEIKSALSDNSNVVFTQKRLKCGWGEWSLVQASLNAVSAAEQAFPDATHFYMLSGDCMPIKSAEYAHDFLNGDYVDYIESLDYFDSNWIKTGMKEERLIYRHFFNERTQKRRFYTAYGLQKRFGLTRDIPEDIQVMIGSQWWCLRRQTIEAILNFIKTRPDVIRFFKTTWIPDETFFQTLVRHLVPRQEIRNRTLTFLMFSDYGMPVSFYNDHYDILLSQDCLFARKISPDAVILKQRLGALYAATDVTFDISNEGRRLYAFLTGRGREGRRYATRFWESESTIGRDRELLIVACKKWHVAKRLVDQIAKLAAIPTIKYVFNENATPLPDLGGIEKTIEKRTRHNRALIRMLFDYYQTKCLVICIDPASINLVQDFYADRSKTRLLEVDCTFSDDYLVGHAARIGLAGDQTPERTLQQLLPTIRNDVVFERDRLRDAAFESHFRLGETASVAENTQQLAQFLSVSEDTAHQIAKIDYLFKD
ncbi:DUF5928 domain-containing protein [Parasulfitobacter algicola]|uniref:Peptide O-xylosyltransferase n=1 Tax=Parasulfitobacter algicola TaxID=2614809 RepID=A0ABX2IQF3_9RHOB|nr:DUF5928 domain-containing protein [Sulfitobacter algicola]NSX53335.1 glycosyl transferase [Sulfitobacter algicola]